MTCGLLPGCQDPVPDCHFFSPPSFRSTITSRGAPHDKTRAHRCDAMPTGNLARARAESKSPFHNTVPLSCPRARGFGNQTRTNDSSLGRNHPRDERLNSDNGSSRLLFLPEPCGTAPLTIRRVAQHSAYQFSIIRWLLATAFFTKIVECPSAGVSLYRQGSDKDRPDFHPLA